MVVGCPRPLCPYPLMAIGGGGGRCGGQASEAWSRLCALPMRWQACAACLICCHSPGSPCSRVRAHEGSMTAAASAGVKLRSVTGWWPMKTTTIYAWITSSLIPSNSTWLSLLLLLGVFLFPPTRLDSRIRSWNKSVLSSPPVFSARSFLRSFHTSTYVLACAYRPQCACSTSHQTKTNRMQDAQSVTTAPIMISSHHELIRNRMSLLRYHCPSLLLPES